VSDRGRVLISWLNQYPKERWVRLGGKEVM
jgi:hypothetical protein